MYDRTDRTTALRGRERISYDRAAAHAVLDEAYHCSLGFTVDGGPRVLPTLHVRVGETLYLHGSTGSRPLLAARDEAVQESFHAAFPNLVYREVSVSNAEGYRSGRAAADRASLNPRRELS